MISVEVKAPPRQPSLWVLAVGIAKYDDHDLELKYGPADATELGRTLQQYGASLYRDVKVVTLVDPKGTKADIEQAFEELSLLVKPEDVFVLYLAGHGVIVDGRYHFITQDARYVKLETLLKSSVDEDRLQQLLSKITAQKSVLLLDTCRTELIQNTQDPIVAARGVGEKGAVERLMYRTGRATLSATSNKRLALEGYEGHGVFTWAVLKGLGGAADRDKDGTVNFAELADYVTEKVPKITNERFGYDQVPMVHLEGQLYPLVRLP